MTGESQPPLIQREIPLLGFLIFVAVLLFFFTRAVADWDRQMTAHAAARWFENGQARLTTGLTDEAVQAFRQATADDPGNSGYALALAGALATAGHPGEAHQILLSLREADPENADVNLHLARLAAAQGDSAEGARYYHNAIYGTWNGKTDPVRQRDIRRELIELFLRERNRRAALSELLALTADTPDTPEAHLDLAALFARAGDNERALDYFRMVLADEGENRAALEGAGRAAFALGDYADATKYLTAAIKAGTPADAVQPTLDVARLVRSADPLAPRLAWAERVRRLTDDVNHAAERVRACLAAQHAASGRSTTQLQAELDDLLAAPRDLGRNSRAADQDVVSNRLEVISASETMAAEAGCGEGDAFDRALVLIGRAHGAAVR